jgi:hypothetical protein
MLSSGNVNVFMGNLGTFGQSHNFFGFFTMIGQKCLNFQWKHSYFRLTHLNLPLVTCVFQRSNCAVKLPVSKLNCKSQYLQPFVLSFVYLCNVKNYKNNRRKDFKLSKMFHTGNRHPACECLYGEIFICECLYGEIFICECFMYGEIFTLVVHINAQEFLNSTTQRDLTNRAVLPSGPARLQYKQPLSPTFTLHVRNTFAEYAIRLNCWKLLQKTVLYYYFTKCNNWVPYFSTIIHY